MGRWYSRLTLTMKRCLFLALLLTMVLMIASWSSGNSATSSSQTATTGYAESEEGWKSQVQAILDAYRTGGLEKGKPLLEEFRIPRPSEYFAEHLGPERMDEYAQRYGRLFDVFATSLDGTLQDIAKNQGADLLVKFLESKGEAPPKTGSPAESGVSSIKPGRFNYCHFQLTLNGKASVSWADSMTYVDGAYRFIGFGAYPFWVWRNGGEGTAPKGGGFPHSVEILSRIDPQYPEAAKNNGIHGEVVLKLLIDRQGQIKKITTVSGDPSLVEAATEAVHQWRFAPGRMGLVPIEMETVVTIRFETQ